MQRGTEPSPAKATMPKRPNGPRSCGSSTNSRARRDNPQRNEARASSPIVVRLLRRALILRRLQLFLRIEHPALIQHGAVAKPHRNLLALLIKPFPERLVRGFL